MPIFSVNRGESITALASKPWTRFEKETETRKLIANDKQIALMKENMLVNFFSVFFFFGLILKKKKMGESFLSSNVINYGKTIEEVLN